MFFLIQPKFKMRYYLTFNTDIRHSHSNMYISNYNWRETRKTFSPTLSCKWNFSPDMTFSMFVYTTPSRNFSFSHNTFLTFLGKSLSLSSKISSHTCTELSVGRFSSALFTFFHDTHFTLIYLWNTQTAFYTVYTSHIKGHDLIIIVGCHLIYRSINIQFNTDDAIPCHPNIFCVCRFFSSLLHHHQQHQSISVAYIASKQQQQWWLPYLILYNMYVCLWGIYIFIYNGKTEYTSVSSITSYTLKDIKSIIVSINFTV